MAGLILNFFLFQFGWFASVVGAARQTPWLGVLAVMAVVAVHLSTKATVREPLLIGTAALTGLLMDTLLLQAGFVTYRAQTPFSWLAPVWIVAMWANFAMTLRHSMRWLEGRYWLSVIMGAVFGPLAYCGASSLGACQLSAPIGSSVALALVWGVALPWLFWVSVKYREL